MPRTLYLAQTRLLRAVLPKPRDISTRADAVRQPRRSARTWLVRERVAGRGAGPGRGSACLRFRWRGPRWGGSHRSSPSHIKAGTGRNTSEGTRAQPRRTRRGGVGSGSGVVLSELARTYSWCEYPPLQVFAQARTRLDCDERLEKMCEVNAKHYEWFSQHEGARPPLAEKNSRVPQSRKACKI